MDRAYHELSYEEAVLTVSEDEIAEADAAAEESVNTGDIIGQPRAVRALTMGAEISARGYNVFVTGPAGTGRHTAVQRILETLGRERQKKKEIALVYNFTKPENPRVLYFGPGEAARFKEDLHQLVENLKKSIKTRLESSLYKDQRDRIIGIIEQEENRNLSDFEKRISRDGFHIVYVNGESGTATEIVPLYGGEPVSFEVLQSKVVSGDVTEETWQEIRAQYHRYVDELKELYHDLREARDSLEQELEALRVETAAPAISAEIEILRKRYGGNGTAAAAYLRELEEDLAANLYLFSLDKEILDEMGNPRFIRYGVNIIEECISDGPAPVVYENHPTIRNLFGSIESRTDSSGDTRSSFMMIRGGSLVKGSGGFIVLPAEELFTEEGVWYYLKRYLQTGMIEIRQPSSSFLPHLMQLKPEPIAVDVRIIIIGAENLYDTLYHEDPDFKKFFKLHASFDSTMERTPGSTAQYTSFIRFLSRRDSLPDVSVSGMCALLEQGIRLAGSRRKLSTRFSLIADYVSEAGYWARKLEKNGIDREAVNTAVRNKQYLADAAESELDEMITAGKLLIRLSGAEIGRVNGLAMYVRDHYSFGRPAVISARVAPGRKGVVNIDREAGLSGELHTKGMLILEGFLRSRYAEDYPLSVYASICFEQSYGIIDGDSASSTEIYAFVSAVTGLPLRQDIAVTGSVNQMGEISRSAE